MASVRCLNCDFRWNTRDDAPGTISCPRCHSGIVIPESGSAYPVKGAPVRVIPVEVEASRDSTTNKIGLFIVIALISVGVAVAITVSRLSLPEGGLVALILVLAFAVALPFIGWKLPQRSWQDPQPAAVNQSDRTTTGRVLHYQRPMPRSNKLSSSAFFGQVVGGIIAGIMSIVYLGFYVQPAPSFQSIFVVPALGVAGCFFRKVRGIGVGLILAIPAIILLVLSFCAIIHK
jgi:hypothetical protein